MKTTQGRLGATVWETIFPLDQVALTPDSVIPFQVKSLVNRQLDRIVRTLAELQ